MSTVSSLNSSSVRTSETAEPVSPAPARPRTETSSKPTSRFSELADASIRHPEHEVVYANRELLTEARDRVSLAENKKLDLKTNRETSLAARLFADNYKACLESHRERSTTNPGLISSAESAYQQVARDCELLSIRRLTAEQSELLQSRGGDSLVEALESGIQNPIATWEFSSDSVTPPVFFTSALRLESAVETFTEQLNAEAETFRHTIAMDTAYGACVAENAVVRNAIELAQISTQQAKSTIRDVCASRSAGVKPFEETEAEDVLGRESNSESTSETRVDSPFSQRNTVFNSYLQNIRQKKVSDRAHVSALLESIDEILSQTSSELIDLK